KLTKNKVLDVIYSGQKETFEVELHSGKIIRVTQEHPFLTINGWTELKNIKVGDSIATPRVNISNGDFKIEYYKLIILAGLLSEGNTCHPSCLYFYNNNKILIDDFVTNVNKFEGSYTTVSKRGKKFEVCINNGTSNKKYKSTIRLWAEKLNLVYKKATEKEFPNFVFELNSDALALFIGRLWSGDGHISTKDSYQPYYATSSLKLAKQL